MDEVSPRVLRAGPPVLTADFVRMRHESDLVHRLGVYY
jgi:hypothetical protein